MPWVFQTLNAVVDAEVRALPPDMLWELRITGRDGISRAIYVTAAGQRVIVVRVFIKKTKDTAA